MYVNVGQAIYVYYMYSAYMVQNIYRFISCFSLRRRGKGTLVNFKGGGWVEEVCQLEYYSVVMENVEENWYA